MSEAIIKYDCIVIEQIMLFKNYNFKIKIYKNQTKKFTIILSKRQNKPQICRNRN